MLRYVKNGMLLLSVAYIVIGMLLLIMPETSLLWICNIFGVVVLVTGIVCLIQYARIRGTGFTAPFMLVGGVITAGLPLLKIELSFLLYLHLDFLLERRYVAAIHLYMQ